MDAELEITSDVVDQRYGLRGNARSLKTLCRFRGREFWVPRREMTALSVFVCERLSDGPGWLSRKHLLNWGLGPDYIDFYRRIYKVRQAFESADIIETAPKRVLLYRVGAEKDRIKVDPAFFDRFEDFSVKALALAAGMFADFRPKSGTR